MRHGRGGTCTSAGPATRGSPATTASSSPARPMAARRTRSPRRSPTRSTGASSATSPLRATGPSSSPGASSSSTWASCSAMRSRGRSRRTGERRSRSLPSRKSSFTGTWVTAPPATAATGRRPASRVTSSSARTAKCGSPPIRPTRRIQGQIYFIKTSNGGADWSAPARITPNLARGHQFFPDIDANAGELHVVWQDSRNDTPSGPPSTPSGGDYRTVPIANHWVSSNPPGSVSVGAGVGVQTFYAVSTNLGTSWTERLVSSAAQMPQYEQFSNRDVPFFGDYNY